MLRVKLNHWQSIVAKDNHRFKIIDAGRRSGKSVLARMIVLQWAKVPGQYWIVSPNYRQAKTIHWNELVEKHLPDDKLLQKHEAALDAEKWNDFTGEREPDQQVILKAIELGYKIKHKLDKPLFLQNFNVGEIGVEFIEADVTGKA